MGVVKVAEHPGLTTHSSLNPFVSTAQMATLGNRPDIDTLEPGVGSSITVPAIRDERKVKVESSFGDSFFEPDITAVDWAEFDRLVAQLSWQ